MKDKLQAMLDSSPRISNPVVTEETGLGLGGIPDQETTIITITFDAPDNDTAIAIEMAICIYTDDRLYLIDHSVEGQRVTLIYTPYSPAGE